MARPSMFTEEIAEAICARLADGLSLREVCRDEAMPSRDTVRRWLRDRPEFQQHYAHAREAQADHLGDEILEIADDASNDWMVRNKGQDNEVEVLNHEHVQRSKLRIEARRWLMGKLAPKKYGEKVAIGGDPDAPPLQVAEASPLDVARRVAFLLARGAAEAGKPKG